MFKKILVANRGEIAVRIIRACRELGIATVAVHSDIDRDCLHVRLADESVCIGPAPANESYLNVPSIISAAEITGADAIHPGYGFLAENAQFAEVCESSGIKFIGPPAEVIRKMGDKVEARKIMKKAGVPIIPGTEEPVSLEDKHLAKIANKIGYPLMVKARAGGGGKGMRLVQNEDALKNAIATAQVEAKASFSNSEVYLEKCIEEHNHIEFQILADSRGRVVYFPERDCSIQRRHQKLLEESPSPRISSKLRRHIGESARRAAKNAGYLTTGTIEFILDPKGDFYFIEMNTRIQVEHTVTEMISGIDLVKEQIRLAAGEKLDYDSDDIKICGHVIECRINAEDWERDFIPCPGKINNFISPGGPGVRIDTHIYSGYTIPPYYDSLVAKIITEDENREKCIYRMQRALNELVIEGITTTIPFHQKIMKNEHFLKGEIDTNFIQKYLLEG